MNRVRRCFLTLTFYLLVFGAIGWGMNYAKVYNSQTLTPFTVVRVVGIAFPPLGAVLGWF